MSKHKTLGQVYTPKWIVDEILELVGYNNSIILDKTILEPACGDGAFLIEIVKRYIKTAKDNNYNNQQIKNNLEQFIYGIEIDKEEYNKCIINLNNFVENEFNISNVKWSIFNDNTLDLYQLYIGKFDYIVGNPPYIRIHNLDANTRQILKNEFLFSEGTIDIYLSFFEMGFKMLNNIGVLGYITPNSYLHNTSYKKFREYLKQNKNIRTLIDFKANKLFNGFSTYTAISIFQKDYDKDYFIYKELANGSIKDINYINYYNLDSKDWSFTNTENTEFLKKLNSNKNSAIKDYFDVQYGFATLRDNIYIGKISETNNIDLVLFNNSLIEKSILKTVVKGSRFKGIIDYNYKILFPYKLLNNRYVVIPESEMKESYPNCYQYLLANKSELLKRDIEKGALWYEFGRSQGIQSIHNEKIILSTLINGKIQFYRIPYDILMYSGLFIIKNNSKSEWNILEQTLQSDDFYKYIRLTGKDFSGGYKSITSKQIKEFKINNNKKLTLF